MPDLKPITVLMPVYNGEKYLKEAIESILNQSFQDVEFLIINDGSTDKSVEIMNSYHDKRIRLIHNQSNKGIIYTLNKGIELSSGKYIARMDCDDISLSVRLEHQLEFMEGHLDVGVCGSWVRLFDGTQKREIKLPIDDGTLRCAMLFQSNIVHPSTMFRKDLLLKHGIRYNESFQHAEDYDIWVRLSSKTKLANIPEVLLEYRLSQGQISSVYHQLQRDTASRIREYQLNFLGIFPTDNEKKHHDSIGFDELEGTKEYLAATKTWLDKIYDANKQCRIYKDSALAKFLSGVWFAVCCKAYQSGNCSFTEYCSTGLISGLSLREKLIFYTDWFYWRLYRF